MADAAAAGWAATQLPGVLRRRLTAHGDERGSFREIWRESWTAGLTRAPFVQGNLSRSQARVLRGMHFHRRQADLWVVVEGSALVALADLRPVLEGHADRPVVETHELGPDEALLIPELVAHGFYARTDLALLYLVTNEFDNTDELGFAWDDPTAAIPWPDREPILSGRDQANPDVVGALRFR